MHMSIRPATTADASLIAAMAVALTTEISTAVGIRQFDMDVENTARLCAEGLEAGRYFAFVAECDGESAGFAGLSEGWALYAGGAVGTLEELYVAPAFRSSGTGAALLAAIDKLALSRGWRRIEVCTPPLPEFDRSLAFYERHGFAITGGRKMKKIPQA